MWVGVLTFYFLNNIFAYTYFKRRVSGSLKLNLQRGCEPLQQVLETELRLPVGAASWAISPPRGFMSVSEQAEMCKPWHPRGSQRAPAEFLPFTLLRRVGLWFCCCCCSCCCCIAHSKLRGHAPASGTTALLWEAGRQRQEHAFVYRS